jgi:hypothetical protein
LVQGGPGRFRESGSHLIVRGLRWVARGHMGLTEELHRTQRAVAVPWISYLDARAGFELVGGISQQRG